MNWLDKIRQRSDTEKRIFSFNLAILITFIITIFWAISTFYSLQNLTKQKEQVASPVNSIISSFKTFFNTGSVDVYKAPK